MSKGRGHEAEAVVAAARAGDQAAFAVLAESYRRELQVHCYRMLGSFEDAEDMVQETFLRAWRKRRSFEGRSSFRAWLYRIATNACLDELERRPPRVLPPQVAPAADPRVTPLPTADLPWLQPYPDRLFEGIAPSDAEPDAALVSKETIELAFLVAIQHLAPRQRAVLILRDALDWSAKETAMLLESTVASVNSALRRARSTLKKHLPARRLEWASDSDPTEEERSLLQRYMDAHERADAAAFAALLREDARLTMPPTPTWYDGREAVVTFHAQQVFVPEYQWRFVVTRANRQPAVAFYTRRLGESEYRASGIDVLRIEDGLIAQIDAFVLPHLFPAFGLPPTV
ncbi:MAG: RNA polymerase subunit sigma-70 [Candidatus Limnocylindria bacterium]